MSRSGKQRTRGPIMLTCRNCGREYDHGQVEAQGFLPASPPAVCSPGCLARMTHTSEGWLTPSQRRDELAEALEAVSRLLAPCCGLNSREFGTLSEATEIIESALRKAGRLS